MQSKFIFCSFLFFDIAAYTAVTQAQFCKKKKNQKSMCLILGFWTVFLKWCIWANVFLIYSMEFID